jgi:hypothetical protein
LHLPSNKAQPLVQVLPLVVLQVARQALQRVPPQVLVVQQQQLALLWLV